MATIRVDGATLHVDLSAWERICAAHGSFAIPLATVAGASDAASPGWWSAWPVIGTHAPFWMMAGTFLYRGELVFFAFGGGHRMLAIDLVPGTSRYAHLFVRVDYPDTPHAAAARIEEARARVTEA